MSKKLLRSLAFKNLRENRKINLPYLFARILFCMMTFIIFSLCFDPGIANMRGGAEAVMFFRFGGVLVCLTAFLFLFNIYQYLFRQRGREFGLYEILGMTKKNIRFIINQELAVLCLVTITSGELLGVIFAGLVQRLLVFFIKGTGISALKYDARAFLLTAVLFLAMDLINSLTAAKNLRKLQTAELFHSSAQSEQIPRVNPLLAGIGLVCLIAGYTVSLQAKKPDIAMDRFMPAVLLIIIGTFCLFREGLVLFLSLLKKNKRYYYKTNHFISTSGLLFRMKRNASGLATICVLSCMVLVSIGATVSVYRGIKSYIQELYPKNIYYFAYTTNELPDFSGMQKSLAHKADTLDLQDVSYKKSISLSGAIENNKFTEDQMADCFATVIDEETYHAMTGISLQLKDYEAAALTKGIDDPLPGQLEIRGIVFPITETLTTPYPKLYEADHFDKFLLLVVKDLDVFSQMKNTQGIAASLVFQANLKAPTAAAERKTADAILTSTKTDLVSNGFSDADAISQHTAIEETYAGNGSLLFVGIFCGILFLLATVLIIYYKQISEGYEDADKYKTLQDVGMDQTSIRRTIRTQVLTTFFMPLLMAVVHIGFVYPMVLQIVSRIGVVDSAIFASSIGIALAGFVIIYILVYWLTSGTYYHIISSQASQTT